MNKQEQIEKMIGGRYGKIDEKVCAKNKWQE